MLFIVTRRNLQGNLPTSGWFTLLQTFRSLSTSSWLYAILYTFRIIRNSRMREMKWFYIHNSQQFPRICYWNTQNIYGPEILYSTKISITTDGFSSLFSSKPFKLPTFPSSSSSQPEAHTVYSKGIQVKHPFSHGKMGDRTELPNCNLLSNSYYLGTTLRLLSLLPTHYLSLNTQPRIVRFTRCCYAECKYVCENLKWGSPKSNVVAVVQKSYPKFPAAVKTK